MRLPTATLAFIGIALLVGACSGSDSPRIEDPEATVAGLVGNAALEDRIGEATPTARRVYRLTTATPQPLPDRKNCDEIRGTPYRSSTEREWFLANCVSTQAPVPPPQPQPSANVQPPPPPSLAAPDASPRLSAAGAQAMGQRWLEQNYPSTLTVHRCFAADWTLEQGRAFWEATCETRAASGSGVEPLLFTLWVFENGDVFIGSLPDAPIVPPPALPPPLPVNPPEDDFDSGDMSACIRWIAGYSSLEISGRAACRSVSWDTNDRNLSDCIRWLAGLSSLKITGRSGCRSYSGDADLEQCLRYLADISSTGSASCRSI